MVQTPQQLDESCPLRAAHGALDAYFHKKLRDALPPMRPTDDFKSTLGTKVQTSQQLGESCPRQI